MTYSRSIFKVSKTKNEKRQKPFFFSITDTDDSRDRIGRERTIFYSTLPLPPAHKHSDIYFQLCLWDDYHIFLIATLVFTRLLLDENLPPYGITIWLIGDVKFLLVSLLDDSILGFCYRNLDTGSRWTRTRTFLLF